MRSVLSRLGGGRVPAPVLSVVLAVGGPDDDHGNGSVAALRATVDSVLAQSVGDLELLVVDGGSGKDARAALDAYRRADPRVTVLRKPAAGRDDGAGRARGEFLTFAALGGAVPANGYRPLVRRLRESGADLAVGRVRRPDGDVGGETDTGADALHAVPHPAATLDDLPEALLDLGVANRVFRTGFWRDAGLRFAGQSDRQAMLTAYLRAGSFDVLSRPSWEQHTGAEADARADLASADEAFAVLRREAPAHVVDWWSARTLEVDLPALVEVARAGSEDDRHHAAATVATWLGQTSDAALDAVSTEAKVAAALAGEGRWDDLTAYQDRLADGDVPIVVVVVDGVAVARFHDEPDFLRGVPPRMLRIAPQELPVEGVVEHVEWSPGLVTVTGWAVRRGLGVTEGDAASFRAWLVDDDGTEVPVAVEPLARPEVDIWGTRPHARYAGGGFRVVAGLELLARSVPARRTTWHLEVEVSYAGLVARDRIRHRSSRSLGARPSGVEHGDATVRFRWDVDRGVCVVVDPDPVRVVSLRIDDGVASGVLALSGGRRLERVWLRTHGVAGTQAQVGDDGTFRVDLPVRPVPAEHASWRLMALDADGLSSPPRWPAEVTPDVSAAVGGYGWRRSAEGDAWLHSGAAALSVDSVGLAAEPDVLVVRVPAADLSEEQAARITLGNPRLQLDRIGLRRDADAWELRYSLLTSVLGGAPRVAPSGRYRVHLEQDGVTTVAWATAAYAGKLAQRHHGAQANVLVEQDPGGSVEIELGPPLAAVELGASNQRRLRERYRSAPVATSDSVLFGCYRGEFATDSQLAIDRMLAEREPGLTRYWGVADLSTVLPDGAVPVLLESAAWYDVLASSRFVCANLDLGSFFEQRPHQRYLQTFHGYPFKSMGIGWWRGRGFTDDQVRRWVTRVNREWDVILVPSQECVRYYREQYAFEGEILVAGYPRCDALVNADAAAVRARVLGLLGVDADTTVVLYAPTYRDWLSTRWHAATRYDELDLDRLAAQLGDGYTLLVRGHNNNQRESARVRRTARIVDVTDYPDINDLTLAADVAVLDYSSLRFDWAITGKPMVFFVPDREEYFAQRPPLFGYEESAPGPLLGTTEEVAAALADPAALRRGYAEALAAFNTRFNGLHDGHATERVVDAFFG